MAIFLEPLGLYFIDIIHSQFLLGMSCNITKIHYTYFIIQNWLEIKGQKDNSSFRVMNLHTGFFTCLPCSG